MSLVQAPTYAPAPVDVHTEHGGAAPKRTRTKQPRVDQYNLSNHGTFLIELLETLNGRPMGTPEKPIKLLELIDSGTDKPFETVEDLIDAIYIQIQIRRPLELIRRTMYNRSKTGKQDFGALVGSLAFATKYTVKNQPKLDGRETFSMFIIPESIEKPFLWRIRDRARSERIYYDLPEKLEQKYYPPLISITDHTTLM